MVSGGSWRDHFKIDDKILKAFWEEFSESSPLRASELNLTTVHNSVEFILWCVREGHFSEEAFTRFQSENFHLPKVRSDFFQAPIDAHFWARVKDLHPWSTACVPLTEWDDHLLIASVWPTETFKTSLRHRLVLGTPTELREFYSRLTTPAAAATPTVSSSTVKKLDDGDPFAALSREFGLASDDAVPSLETESSPSDAEAAPDGLIVPEGLIFNREDKVAENSSLAETQPSYKIPTKIPTPAAPPEPASAPASIIAPPSPPPKNAVPKTPVAPVVMPFAPTVTPQKPASVKPQVPPPPMTPAPSKADTMPARPVAEATVVVSADDALELEEKIASRKETSPLSSPGRTRRPLFEPSAAANPAPPATAAPSLKSQMRSGGETQTGTGSEVRKRRLEATPVTSFFGMSGNTNPGTRPKTSRAPEHYLGRSVNISKIEPIHLDECTTIDEGGAQALLQACNIFETSMILLFKDGALQPWKWNDLFLSVKGEKPDAIDLTDPSIFKVVFRTAKPYHGYVVTSAVNQKFFNEFNRGMLPKHATVIPIMIDGRMGGMLLGFTNAKIDYRQSLRLMERLSFDLSRVFKTLRGTMSKAG